MNFTAALPSLLLVALALVMFGLGLSLTVQDFARLRQHPRSVLLALVLQMLVLPASAGVGMGGMNMVHTRPRVSSAITRPSATCPVLPAQAAHCR